MFGSQFGLLSRIKKAGARAVIATGFAIMAIIGGDSSTYARGDTVSGVSAAPPRVGWMKKFMPAADPAPLPATGFTEQDGTMRTLKDFGGRLVLMNFWATWCGPCVREMPSLERLQEKLGSRDFTVIALSEDRTGWEKITPFREKLGLTALPLFHDVGSRMMFGAKVRGLPTTILIGRDGTELGRLTGDAEWDSDEAVALIRYYLGKS